MDALRGKTAIVTGAGRGFGRAVAIAMAAAGAKVSLLARTDAEIAKVAAEIGEGGGTAVAIACDLLDTDLIAAAHDRHVQLLGPADILVNCAGACEPIGPIGTIDAAAWWTTMTLNLGAPLHLMSRVLPQMRGQGRGCIINISSIAACATVPFNSVYAVSKAALNNLTEHVAAECAGTGISVFAVHPGAAFTSLMQATLQSENMARWLPDIGRFCETLEKDADADAVMRRCGAYCVSLAAGRHDELSGQFLNFEDPGLAIK